MFLSKESRSYFLVPWAYFTHGWKTKRKIAPKGYPTYVSTTIFIAARRDFFLCHDVRRLSACFMYPGCSDNMAASVSFTLLFHTSVVIGSISTISYGLREKVTYAGISSLSRIGKTGEPSFAVPFNVVSFPMCDQACSRDSVFICRKDMTRDEQEDEQVATLLLFILLLFQSALTEISKLVLRIAADADNSDTCDRIKHTLRKVRGPPAIFPNFMHDFLIVYAIKPACYSGSCGESQKLWGSRALYLWGLAERCRLPLLWH